MADWRLAVHLPILENQIGGDGQREGKWALFKGQNKQGSWEGGGGGAMSCPESHGDSNCTLQEWDDRCSLLVPGMNVRAGKGPETLDSLLITKVKVMVPGGPQS